MSVSSQVVNQSINHSIISSQASVTSCSWVGPRMTCQRVYATFISSAASTNPAWPFVRFCMAFKPQICLKSGDSGFFVTNHYNRINTYQLLASSTKASLAWSVPQNPCLTKDRSMTIIFSALQFSSTKKAARLDKGIGCIKNASIIGCTDPSRWCIQRSITLVFAHWK